MYTAVPHAVDFPQLEREVAEFWQAHDVFTRSIENRPQSESFYFYDGPPFATGLPHYGHILAGVIKDVIPRYQSMLGRRVERKFGWDCHGLPVEREAEKELGVSGHTGIAEYGIDKFNEYCRSIVLRYSNEWRATVNRTGRWVDLENDYKTMDKPFMESVWWVFRQLWEKDLIYRTGRVVPYSPTLHTPLSNFEVNLGEYLEVNDPSLTSAFRSTSEEDTYFLSWTTTPWTLPSNLCLTVSPEMSYALVQQGNKRYYIGEQAIPRYFKPDEIEVLQRVAGAELEGMRYEPLFPYFAAYQEKAFFVALGDYVDDQTGTGIVHTAPMFGEDDFATSTKYNLPIPNEWLVDESGIFTKHAPEFAGLGFKAADKPIIAYLKEQGSVFKRENITHRYPYCWRSGTPLMYRLIPSWYVKVEQMRPLLLKNNEQVHWAPEHIKHGRMGKWLENAKDWSISRNRYWGTPIPVWICADCGHQHCVGSIAELEEATQTKLEDIHRHYIDHLSIDCPKCLGKNASGDSQVGKMQRTEEVLDCWFESGSMPYAQEHYPFENKDKLDRVFPAHFISEGLDQTRGWFYTLAVLSACLFEKPAFRNVIVSGMLLAKDGKKMSKKERNYPDPNLLFDRYGVDAVRLYLLNSPAVKADALCFSEEGVKETMRSHLIPLWNVLSFFTTYAELDRWENTPLEGPEQLTNELDLWLMARLQGLVGEVRAGLDAYALNQGVAPIVRFIDELTNWYVRRSRRRFWKSDYAADKHQAYLCLRHTLLTLAQLMAPLTPFIAERIYSILKDEAMPDSVHLCDYPQVIAHWQNIALEQRMEQVMRLVSLGRNLRVKENIKIRQPLASCSLLGVSDRTGVEELAHLIADELNVKAVYFHDNEKEFIDYTARPNLPRLGKRYGKKLKALQAQIADLCSADILALKNGQSHRLDCEGEAIVLTAEDILIDRQPKENVSIATDANFGIVLDTQISEALAQEGFIRELISQIQQQRKNMGLQVADAIRIELKPERSTAAVLEHYREYVMQETVAKEYALVATLSARESMNIALNGYSTTITISIKE